MPNCRRPARAFVRAMLAILIATSTGIAAATPVATRLAPVQSTASAAPVTELVIDSDLTDPIGVGEHRTYTLSNSTFRLEEVTEDAHGVPNWISMYVNGSQPNDYWEITFTSRQTDRPLAVGFYERAEEAALGESGHPGLAVRGQDRNCRLLIGRFTVEDLRYTSGALEGFAISFEQHCDRNEPALRGHLYYNYTAPATVTFAPAEVLGGQSSVATVTLAAPAPAGGTTVDLVTNHPELATVPRTITVPEGAVLAEFPVTTDVQKYVTEAEVLATVAGVAAHARLSAVSPIASLTALDMKSDRGDYIGAGATYRLTPGTGRFAVYGVRVPGSDGLAMAGFSYRSVGGPDTVWYGDFSTARLGAPMTPGLTYTGAQRANNEDAGHPGLNISGIGRGCNQLTGAFRVLVSRRRCMGPSITGTHRLRTVRSRVRPR